jgi:hypothetical protein
LSLIRTRGRPRPFAWGFVATLAVAMCAYILCCLTIPDLVRVSVVYEVDAIVRSVYEASPLLIYRLSLEVQGLLLGLPQLTVALIGGLLSRTFLANVCRP